MSDAMSPDAGTNIEPLPGVNSSPGTGAPARPTPPSTGADVSRIASDLGIVNQRKAEALAPYRQAQADRAAAGVTELHRRYDAIEPVDVQPWTAKPPEWEPIKEFGSTASVFAQIAAMFTGTPARNALKGAAAAMRAQRQNDIYTYEQGYKTWKDNSELALRRHDAMMQDYRLASDLLKTDLAAGTAQMEAIGAKYGDEITVKLAQAGLYKDLENVWTARDNSARGWSSIMPALNKEAERRAILLRDPDWQSGDPARMAKAEQRANEAMATWRMGSGAAGRRMADIDMAERQKLYDEAVAEAEKERGAPLTAPEKLALRNTFMLSAKDNSVAATNAAKLTRLEARDAALEEHRTRMAEIATRKYETAEARKQDELFERQRHNQEMEKLYAQRASATMTNVRAGAVQAKLDEIRTKENREPTAAEQAKAIQDVTRSGMTGNRADQLMSKIDLFDDSLNKIDGALGVLDKYVGAAGLAGRATRMGERVGNIFGSNDTERVQFMRDIEYLQALGSQLLMDRGGRPLSAEANKMADIIAGLNAGDTTANTIRALTEVKTLYAKMREDTKLRLSGEWRPSEEREPGSPGAPAPRTPAPGAVPAKTWEQFPAVGGQ